MKTRRLFLVSFLIVAMSILTGWRSHHHKKNSTAESTTEITKPKTLDLSLPLKIEEKTDAPVTQIKIEKPKKIQREIELETQAIMSIEPEKDKIKSFDGAGFAINIKP